MDDRLQLARDIEGDLECLLDSDEESGREPAESTRLRLADFKTTMIELLDVNTGGLKLRIEEWGPLPNDGPVRAAWIKMTRTAGVPDKQWTEEELAGAFEHELKWESEISLSRPAFDMNVPDTINEAVQRRYKINQDTVFKRTLF